MSEEENQFFVQCLFQMTSKILEDFYLAINIRWRRADIERAIKYFNTDYENNLFKDQKLEFVIYGKKLEE